MVLLNLIELDNTKQLKALEQLFTGIETMQPQLIVCTGRFFSERACENDSFTQLKRYVERLAGICKDFTHLLNISEWVFVPSLEEPGQV